LHLGIGASIDPVFLRLTLLYAKAMSTGGGRVKRENTEKCLERTGCNAANIAATMSTLGGKDCGMAG
jgi:hypothetical protein